MATKVTKGKIYDGTISINNICIKTGTIYVESLIIVSHMMQHLHSTTLLNALLGWPIYDPNKILLESQCSG